MPSIGGSPVMERSCGTDCEDFTACAKTNAGEQKSTRKIDLFIQIAPVSEDAQFDMVNEIN
jgi:hypothetical protein